MEGFLEIHKATIDNPCIVLSIVNKSVEGQYVIQYCIIKIKRTWIYVLDRTILCLHVISEQLSVHGFQEETFPWYNIRGLVEWIHLWSMAKCSQIGNLG